MSLSLSGCVVGPDFATPATPPLQLDYLAKQSLSGSPSMPVNQWWSSFGDHTLNELLNRAQAQNLSLREAYERIIEARANYRLQGGQLKPNGNVFGEYAYNKRSPNSRPFVGQNGNPFNLGTLGLETSWEIDLFGRIARQLEAADAELQFQEADFESIRQTLFADIVTSYLQIRLFQSQLALLEQNMLIQEHTARLVAQRTEAGVSTELDRSQTQSFSFRTRSLYVALNQQLELEYNHLSLLMGQTPDRVLQDFVGIAPLPMMPAIPDAGLPADLIRRRPDIRRQEMAVKAASALIGVAESDLYPRLTLIGNIALSSKNLSGLFETDGLEFDLGPSFTWNILHFGRICDNIEIHEARFRQAVAAWQQSILAAVREVEDTMVNHNGFMEQRAVIEQAIAADERAVQLSLERYRAGKANFQRVIDAQQQLVNDQQQRFQFQADAMIELVRLFKAAGGDWTIGSQTINGCQSCFVPNGVVQASPVATGAFQVGTEVLGTGAVLEVQTSPSHFGPVSAYPLQQSIAPETIAGATSPFSPNENQSVFVTPPPEAAEPLQNAREILTERVMQAPYTPSQATAPLTTPPVQPSGDNWLWN